MAIITLLIGLFFVAPKVFAASTGGIDADDKYAWGENVGWINFGTDEGDVYISDTAITGYAWGENIGWISLNCSDSDTCDTVDYGISNDGEGNLSGYAWSENAGWIDFDPTYGGVTIDSAGNFAGYAWGENIGWIVFNCATTDSCDTIDYKVKTGYSVQSARPACNNSLDDDGDGKTDYPADPGCISAEDTDEADPGGGAPPGFASSPSAPAITPEAPQGFQVVINSDDTYTGSPIVSLTLRAGDDTERMIISNYEDFHGAYQENYIPAKQWDLCAQNKECPEGLYTVYAKFITAYGNESVVVSDSIMLTYGEIPPEEEPGAPEPKPEDEEPLVTPPAEGPGEKPSIIDRIPDFLKPLLPDFLKPLPPEEAKKPITKRLPKPLQLLVPEFLKKKAPQLEPKKLPDIEELVPKEPPLAFQSRWDLLPEEPVRKFVFSPLPLQIRKLADKFPALDKTFSEVGVKKITDISKLSGGKFQLPGLTESAGIAKTEVGPGGRLVLPRGIKISELTPELKQKIPEEVVFAKAGAQLIDFNADLTVSEEGQPQQKISTVVGKPLTLVVKPEQPVKSVKGYIVFKYRRPTTPSINMPLSSILNSPAFAKPALAHPAEDKPLLFVEGGIPLTSEKLAKVTEVIDEKTGEKITVEERLVLMEFEYTDPDGDGIYTAEITAPLVDGEYEVITVMDYEDPSLGKKEIRLVTVVDPEGYVYESYNGKEIRVPGAVVEIFWLNPETKQYESWPAVEFQQESPQITDATGKYSFLVPEGSYYITADAPGYLPYESKPFQVREGSGVHFNIELKTRYWWLRIVDWKTAALIIVILLLLYNFYKDRRREKIHH